MKRSILLSLALASTVLLASCGTSSPSSTATAPAGTEQAAAPTYAVFAEDGIAIRGADPVAYFTVGEYTPGSDEFTYDWEGTTWQFASAENRDLFAANPEDYAPQYGGFCAYAVSQGTTASIEPTSWKIVDGKLYLNYDARIQERWSKDIPGHIAQADQNWPGVLAN
ncbi:yhs domain-containing protein [Leptolyngbya sp. Heron Island J]|uniref:YHS domain-containing (seleno)protein n=1 Tax=Leptolyngbya sp. Heron Island J TaxID=1385935 RepID=UPI0003B96AF3|nr:YHS domain-containing (seleno)protein [Leptolyngbya sp. Heron Island J]ESA38287.1 yhs domain-containing protein [Leptolyngbya sp. Heron Island J]